jgi:predicted DsbA family dithiol-disulfide isomerase
MMPATAAVGTDVKVEIWSDVVCPWCYIGKRRFEAALADFEHREQVEVVWRSFELDPSAPRSHSGAYAERLAAKYRMRVVEAQANIDHMVEVGAQNGVVFNFDVAQPGNTFDAHRLLHLALDRGKQDVLKERFLAAAFTEGAPIGDAGALAALATEVGLPPDDVRAVLDGDTYAADVRADEQRATMLGISAVPFFVVAERYGLAGAQPTELILQVLEDAWAETAPVPASTGAQPEAAPGCADDSCAIPN